MSSSPDLPTSGRHVVERLRCRLCSSMKSPDSHRVQRPSHALFLREPRLQRVPVVHQLWRRRQGKLCHQKRSMCRGGREHQCSSILCGESSGKRSERDNRSCHHNHCPCHCIETQRASPLLCRRRNRSHRLYSSVCHLCRGLCPEFQQGRSNNPDDYRVHRPHIRVLSHNVALWSKRLEAPSAGNHGCLFCKAVALPAHSVFLLLCREALDNHLPDIARLCIVLPMSRLWERPTSSNPEHSSGRTERLVFRRESYNVAEMSCRESDHHKKPDICL